MDYKVKYEQALERAKYLKETTDGVGAKDVSRCFEEIFPELKESEDEDVRQYIIRLMKQRDINIPMVQKALAWLEKQGEQKSIDKDEPKFKVGDWIVADNDKSRIFRVECIGRSFSIINDNFGNQFINNFILNERYRLWTIRDAKDGDVLVTPNNNIFIFKEIQNHCQVFDHCGLYFDSLTAESSCVNGIFSEELPNDYKLATKEQRDLLFKKMKEVGYEWDDGKNELKKIGQNPTEDNCKISDCDIKVGVKKSASAWSEKDNGMMVLVAKILYNHKSDTDFVLYNTPYKNVVKWLKSLKNRV